MGVYDLSIGTLLVGIFFNTFLYGLVTYQFAQYYQRKSDDRLATKCMVGFLFILDTFHSAAVIYLAWIYFVTNYDNPIALGLGEWPYEITPICTALTALVTQVFLGFRIWSLTESKILFGIVTMLSITSFVLGFACSIEAWIIWIISELPQITPLVIAWLVTQVVVDAFITVTLVIIFSRSRTGFRRMDTVLNRLIRGAIQTGLFAGIFSLGDLISFAVAPNTNFYGMFAIPLGRIYTNTLLHSLLSRDSLKAELHATFDVSKAVDEINWAGIGSPQGPSKQSNGVLHQELEIIQRTTVRHADEKVQNEAIPVMA